ncbi:MAG: long-chain fatty acid--CoA ligase [Bacteroidales bacterium]|nr:long-chain fatty acid--CoA ligase [Bacteroidales bacterium]
MQEVTRIFDLLDYCCERYHRRDALACKEGTDWKTFDYGTYRNNVDILSYGLLALGVKRGDKIVTVSNNRPEWNFVDMAVAQTGAVHVPVYPTISTDDYEYIFNHSECKFVFVSDSAAYRRISAVVPKVRTIQKVFSFNNIDGVENLGSLVELGEKSKVYYAKELIQIKQSIHDDDVVSIIYTSGTTGLSKGVMLTHRNFVSNFTAGSNIIGRLVHDKDRIISILPLCHVYERCFCYMYQYNGIGIYYAQNLGTIVRDICDIHANGCNTVPRIAEKIIEGIMKEGAKLTGLRKRIFDYAVNLGYRFEHFRANGLGYSILRSIFNILVYRKWRKNYFGGEMKFFGCGGAALPVSLSRLLWAAGINVQEGYGLTETSPIIAHSVPGVMGHKFSSVGPIVSNVDVKTDEDGEILVKGPNVMKGYYKNPELTAQVFTEDGYFRTGDIGYVSAGNCLHITDRKKDVFKTSGGKYIAPQMVEGKFKESKYISQIMVIGENQKFASAIISPNFEELAHYLQQSGIRCANNRELISNPEVLALMDSEVKRVNKLNGKTEEIKRFRMVADVWSAETGELSQTQKLKRKVVAQKYQDIISEIYSVSAV